MKNYHIKKTDVYGNTCYYSKKHQLHRIGGPAFITADGDKEWYLNGKRHREDGPAIEWEKKCYVEWWFNGELHREDGPAVETKNGNKLYYLNNKHHLEKNFLYRIKYKENYKYSI